MKPTSGGSGFEVPVSWVQPGVLLFLGFLTIIALGLMIWRLCKNERPRFDGNWGGFGGAAGGWQMSPALTYFVAAIIFAILLSMVGIYSPQKALPKDSGAETKR